MISRFLLFRHKGFEKCSYYLSILVMFYTYRRNKTIVKKRCADTRLFLSVTTEITERINRVFFSRSFEHLTIVPFDLSTSEVRTHYGE